MPEVMRSQPTSFIPKYCKTFFLTLLLNSFSSGVNLVLQPCLHYNRYDGREIYLKTQSYLRHHSMRPSPSLFLAQWLSAKFFMASAYSLSVCSSSQCSRQILSKSPTERGKSEIRTKQPIKSVFTNEKERSRSFKFNTRS